MPSHPATPTPPNSVTVICVDGLGGYPQATFGGLESLLKGLGYNVVLVSIAGIRTHEDRVQRVLQAFKAETGAESWSTKHVFLVGQSAGGSAVRIAAERLERHEQLAGIVMMSPAMPSFYAYLTTTLARIMARRLPQLLLGRDIRLTEKEFRALVGPAPGDTPNQVALENRPIVPGKEARRLAGLSFLLGKVHCPVLHIYGTKDRWINPPAQRKLSRKMLHKGMNVNTQAVIGAGHVTLLSEQGSEVAGMILGWIRAKA